MWRFVIWGGEDQIKCHPETFPPKQTDVWDPTRHMKVGGLNTDVL